MQESEDCVNAMNIIEPALLFSRVRHGFKWMGLLLGLLLAGPANATDFTSVKAGNWFDPATWGQLTAFPFTGDNVAVSSNDIVSLTFSNTLYLQINNLVLSNSTLGISSASGQGHFAIAGADSYWTNGALGGSLTQLGTLRLAGNNGTTTGSAITNRGTIQQTDAGNLNPFETTIMNLPGGTYDFAGDGSVNAGQNNSLATFINEGTLLKSSGVNTSSVATTFENLNGTIEVDSGILDMPYNVGSTNGNFIVESGATLDITGGGNAQWTGTITGTGAGQVALRSSSLSANPALALDFPDGLFQWTGGGMSGIVTNLGVITLAGTNTVTSPGLLVNAGLFRQTNDTAWLKLPNTTVENLAGATYDLDGNGGFANGGFGVGGYFDNFGLFRKSGGTGVSSFGNSVFANYGGTLEVDSGTVQITYSFVQTNGVTWLNGGNLAGGTLNFNGGLLTGFGSVTGTVVNAEAIVNPGNSGLGALDIAGTYQQHNGGALDILLGGTNTGTFGQLDVSGNASLGGSLKLSLTNNYTPAMGDQFQILSCSSRSGSFSLPPAFPTGISVNYSSSGVFLVVTGAVVFPAQILSPKTASGSFAFGFQTVTNESYTVQRNDDLTTTNWVDFTNFTGDGGLKSFVLPVTNVPQRFFRVREP